METSFPLPNKVGCSDVRKPTQTNLDQIEMIRTKYNRVNAERTRALGSSKAKPDGTLKTLAHHEMKLKILKLVLACVAVATFLNIAAFGGLFYYLVSWFYSVLLH